MVTENPIFGVDFKDKIAPGQVLLLAEPVFRYPDIDESKTKRFQIPPGTETWIPWFKEQNYSRESLENALGNEYLSLCYSLRNLGVNFRPIVAHRKQIDQKFMVALLYSLEIRGLAMHESISETCFPRDMMVDFGGKVFVNPDANLAFPDGSAKRSRLGDGGGVLEVDKKVFVVDPKAINLGEKERYHKDIIKLSKDFKFAFLPAPAGLEIDTDTGQTEVFKSNHIDRVASFVKGKDHQDYLLVDEHYLNDSRPPWGQYYSIISQACSDLGVNLLKIKRDSASIPYGLNLIQFKDGSVLLTGGDTDLSSILGQIVGQEMVHTTDRSVVLFPLLRKGGLRCMTLFAPSKIVGEPVIPR